MYSVPQRQIAQSFFIDSPRQGMYSTDALASMNSEQCVYAYNIIPTEYGFTTRLGSSEHSRIASGTNVWSLIPYVDPTESGSNNSLFSVTSDGIYDSTTRSTSPTKKLDFSTKSGNAGYGSWSWFINDSGGSPFIFYADAENGLFDYNPATTTWAAATGFTFPDSKTVADLVFVMSHKLRQWFIPKNSSFAYYLPINSKAGSLTRFDFGNKFARGGYLVGLYTWSLDSGNGPDDYLVAIGSGGDMVIYQGDDPSSASTWSVVGSWYIGPPPAGRRIAVDYGGDFHVLTVFGIISATALMRGVRPELQNPAGLNKIIRERLASSAEFTALGWEIVANPSQGELLIITPNLAGAPEHYVQNMITGGWAIWRDLSIKSFTTWNNSPYFGDDAKVVWEMLDGLDGLLIDDSSAGNQIDFSWLSSYQDFGIPASQKQVNQMHPYFLVNKDINYSLQARYDFDVLEINSPGDATGVTGAVWDTAIWDTAIWSGTDYVQDNIGGQAGLGRKVAIAMRGSTRNQMTMIGIDVYVITGGMM